ncbi:hypothetical protein [Kineococcus sp. SYSU DK018]|uniref:hypothetical protein n=1 Tax=Kineococcus sp. SYSU DK018 TaxID=3383139 RepID=UPI003D7D6847
MNTGETRGEAPCGAGSPGTPRRSREVLLLPGRGTAVLLLVVAALSAVSLLSRAVTGAPALDGVPGLDNLERWFYVDREGGVPAWFNAVLLFVCAERLWQVSRAARAEGHPQRRWRRHWLLLAVAFGYLSFDEMSAVHEIVIGPLREGFGLTGFLSFAWVVVAVPLVVAFGLLFVRFLLAQSPAVRWGVLLSAAVYLGGAVGVEVLSAGAYSSLGEDSALYVLAAGVEEALEMAGLVLFLGVVTTVLHGGPAGPAVVTLPRDAASRRASTTG